MILDPNKYKHLIPTVKRIVEKDLQSKPICDMISDISIATSLECMIVCIFIGRLYGKSEELIHTMNELQKFYKYSEIIPLGET